VRLDNFILQTKDLCMNFGGVTALVNLNMTIKEGEIFGLIGPNGSGKTTLFNLISRIYLPSHGVVYYKERDISALPVHRVIVEGISRTFQNIRVFLNLSVIDNVLIGYHSKLRKSFWGSLCNTKRIRNLEQEAREKAMANLRFVNLSEKTNEFARNLSYGEQRRLEMARALASDPLLLLLDEPTAGMNPNEALELTNLIRAIKERGKTIFIIEHNMKVIMNVAERIVVLDSGKKIAEGTPEEIQKDKKVEEAYLGREEG